MVRTLLFVLAFAVGQVATGCTLHAPGIPAGGATGPVLTIDTLDITENGAASPTVDPDECRGFVLNEDTVKRILENSEAISRDDYIRKFPWSPCLVRGRAAFAGGRLATWTIRQYGTGSILLDDGGESFLWCQTCTDSPFLPIE